MIVEIQYMLLQNRVGINPPLNIDPLRPSWPELPTINWPNYVITETTNEQL